MVLWVGEGGIEIGGGFLGLRFSEGCFLSVIISYNYFVWSVYDILGFVLWDFRVFGDGWVWRGVEVFMDGFSIVLEFLFSESFIGVYVSSRVEGLGI